MNILNSDIMNSFIKYYSIDNQKNYIITSTSWDNYTNQIKVSSPEESELKEKILKKIKNYVSNNFKHKSNDIVYYSTTGYIIEDGKTTEQLEDIYKSIRELNKNINHYDIFIMSDRLSDSLCDTAVIFYCTEPNDEEYNSKFASNYFDVDDIWLNEIRFLK